MIPRSVLALIEAGEERLDHHAGGLDLTELRAKYKGKLPLFAWEVFGIDPGVQSLGRRGHVICIGAKVERGTAVPSHAGSCQAPVVNNIASGLGRCPP